VLLLRTEKLQVIDCGLVSFEINYLDFRQETTVLRMAGFRDAIYPWYVRALLFYALIVAYEGRCCIAVIRFLQADESVLLCCYSTGAVPSQSVCATQA
jgi:hypothetical protein